jgi:transposase
MAKPHSRVRATATAEGVALRHEVEALFEVSPSSVINWLPRWRDDDSSAAKLRSALS